MNFSFFCVQYYPFSSFFLHKLSFPPSLTHIGPPWILLSPHFLPFPHSFPHFPHSFFCSDFDMSVLPCSYPLPVLLTTPALLSVTGACGGLLQSLPGMTCLTVWQERVESFNYLLCRMCFLVLALVRSCWCSSAFTVPMVADPFLLWLSHQWPKQNLELS